MHLYSVNPWMILPFVLLLGAIALLPLLAHKWWEHYYPFVAFGLGLVTVFYYLGALHQIPRIVETAHEYISFICLIGSLFVVSGGIRIDVKGESTPLINTMMLAIGGILSNLVGTTGASMLLIRPFIRANKYRLTSYHIIFFIFIVSNVGGCLTALGDPPLYLGYLRGVPFTWTFKALLPMWLIGMGWLLILFYYLDRRNFLRAPVGVRERETSHETWKFEGLKNFAWFGVILVSLFIHSPVFLREILMVFAALMSWKTTQAHIHQANNFSWAPLKEVMILFAGIFATMLPALDWLEANANALGFNSVASFYWGSGILSSVLDNAPTYLNFMSAAVGKFVDGSLVDGVRQLLASGGAIQPSDQRLYSEEVLRTAAFLKQHHADVIHSSSIPLSLIQTCSLLANHVNYIIAISIGCVFFGASTYIGNGPNFMVKNIAEHGGAKMPTFFGYIFKYSLPILLPMFALIGWLFF